MGTSLQKAQPLRPLGGKTIFYWEEIVAIEVADQFNPFKKSKYQRLVKSVDHIASTYKGCDLLLAMYERKGLLTIVEGQPAPSAFTGAAMTPGTVHTSHYDPEIHAISIHFGELDKLAYTSSDGQEITSSLEYVLYYLFLHAAETESSFPARETPRREQHLPY